MLYNEKLLDDISGIRGFEQLIQGDESIKKMLVEEYERTGKKVVSFYKVRNEVISNKFLDYALKEFIYAVVNEKRELLTSSELDAIRNFQIDLCEKVLRDHIPHSAVVELKRALFLLYIYYEKNTHVLFRKIKKYIQFEKPKFAQVLRKSLDIIEEHAGDASAYIESDDSEMALII